MASQITRSSVSPSSSAETSFDSQRPPLNLPAIPIDHAPVSPTIGQRAAALPRAILQAPVQAYDRMTGHASVVARQPQGIHAPQAAVAGSEAVPFAVGCGGCLGFSAGIAAPLAVGVPMIVAGPGTSNFVAGIVVTALTATGVFPAAGAFFGALLCVPCSLLCSGE